MSYGIDRIISELHKVESYAKETTVSPQDTSSISFGSILQNAIEDVNNLSQTANHNVKALEQGDHSQSIAGVMASVQEADIAFQQMAQIRNKLVQAYTEMMNMQI